MVNLNQLELLTSSEEKKMAYDEAAILMPNLNNETSTEVVIG